MIVKMKKYSFLVFHRDYDSFLKSIGELGALHVSESSDSHDEESLEDDRKEIKRINSALDIINAGDISPAGIKNDKPEISVEQASEMLSSIEESAGKREKLEEVMSELSTEIKRAIPWGEYDRDDIDKLKEAGYIPRFYRCSINRYESSWEEDSHFFPVSVHGGKQYFIVLETEDKSIEIDAEPADPGDLPPGELRNKYKEKEKEHRDTQKELDEMRQKAVPSLLNYRRKLENDLSFKEVYQDTQKATDGKVMILEGWVPEEAEDKS